LPTVELSSFRRVEDQASNEQMQEVGGSFSIENGSETEAVIQSKGKVWDTIHCATVFNSS